MMNINNRNIQCLIDTGSVISIISDNLSKRLNLKIQPSESENPLLAANGKALKITGETDVIFNINGLHIPHTLKVVENLFPSLILGVDFLLKNQASISYSDNSVCFYDGLIRAPLQGFASIKNCAVAADTFCIPKFSEALIPVKIPNSYNSEQVILEPLRHNKKTLATASCISKITNHRALLRVKL